MSGTGAYDADGADERPRGQEYLSRRDVRALLIVAVVLAGLLAPIYIYLKADSEAHQCAGNFKAMFDALGTYAELYDDRYPPIYATSSGDAPMLDAQGRPFTWSSLLFDAMNPRRNFRCPTATDAENVVAQHPGGSQLDLPTSYGMYVAMAARQRSLIANPSQTALVAETANRGASDTFDPVPLLDSSGRPAPDGFLIGYDDDNFRFSPATRRVTRLAFPGTGSGRFDPAGKSRHREGIHALLADGQLAVIKPPAAEVEHLSPNLVGLWSTR